MVNNIEDSFPEEINGGDSDESVTDISLKGETLAEKRVQEQAQKNLLARKRIDELKEKKRLKDLLDDSEDW